MEQRDKSVLRFLRETRSKHLLHHIKMPIPSDKESAPSISGVSYVTTLISDSGQATPSDVDVSFSAHASVHKLTRNNSQTVNSNSFLFPCPPLPPQTHHLALLSQVFTHPSNPSSRDIPSNMVAVTMRIMLVHTQSQTTSRNKIGWT